MRLSLLVPQSRPVQTLAYCHSLESHHRRPHRKSARCPLGKTQPPHDPRRRPDQCLKASHVFNILDARGAISVAQRAGYIGRIRDITKAAAGIWLDSQS